MAMSKDYPNFMGKLNKYRPRIGSQYVLLFDCEKEDCKGFVKEAANRGGPRFGGVNHEPARTKLFTAQDAG
jgi:hypothetical protein